MASRATVFRGAIGLASEVTVRVTEPGKEGVDRDGRAWQLGEDGKTWERLFGGLTSAEAKRAYALRRNMEGFTEHFRHEQCGLLTLTVPDDATPFELARRWNNLRRTGRGHEGLTWVRSFIRVLEPHKDESPHWHLAVATPFDLKPGAFNWEAFKETTRREGETREQFARRRGTAEWRAARKRYVDSATPELRRIWSQLRRLCPKFGLGRAEFLPFRKEAGAVACYVGKYLEGGLAYRRDAWKGARRVEYDRTESAEWKVCGSSFGWVSPGANTWRKRVGELARAVGASTPEELVKVLGRRWAYHARPTIITAGEVEWRAFLQYLAGEYGGKVERSPLIVVGGQVGAWFLGSGEGDCRKIATVHDPGGFLPEGRGGAPVCLDLAGPGWERLGT